MASFLSGLNRDIANVVELQHYVERGHGAYGYEGGEAIKKKGGSNSKGESMKNYHVSDGNIASSLSVTPRQATPQVNTGKGKSKKSKKGSSSGKNSS